MKYIHETVVRDIVDLATQVKDIDAVQAMMNRNKSMKSISQASAAYTCVFPVLVDDTLSIDSASVVTKAQERQATAMMQMLLSANMLTDVDSTIDFIRTYHKNIRISNKPTLDDILYISDKLSESYESPINNMEVRELLMNDMKNDNFYLEESINDQSLSRFSIKKNYKGENIVLEKKDESKFHELRRNLGSDIRSNMSDMIYQQSQSDRDYMKGLMDHNMKAVVSGIEDALNKHASSVGKASKTPQAASIAKATSDLATATSKMLMDNDVKKSNELVPTMLNVTVMLKKDDEERLPVNFIVGIKAKMYPLSSNDIVARLAKISDDKNVLFKFIKATTKEISFFRDFMFAIEQAKIDAISQGRKGSSSKLWKVLERRAKLSKFKRTMGIANDAMAITTLALSQTTVERLKKDYNINIEKESIARDIMNNLNLLSIVIVDEIMELTKWIYDTGEDLYQVIPMSQLEREASDNTYKKLINIIGKMR